MKKLLIALVIFLAIFFFITRFTEMQKIAEVLQAGDLRFISLAFLLEGLWILNLGATYGSIYKIFGLYENMKKMLILAMTANFIGTVAPSAGLTGLAVFLTDAEKENQSKGHVTVACIVFLLLDYIGLLLIIALGLLVLLNRNDLNLAEILATFVLFLIAAGMGTILYLSKNNSGKLAKLLVWGMKLINRFTLFFTKKEKFASMETAYTFAADISEGMQVLKNRSKDLLIPFRHTILNKVLLMGVLASLFLAFKTPFSFDTIVAGFSIAYLFLIVSPTPSGIGVVEGVLAVFLHTLGVPLEEATIITLAYRGITFWFPILVGFITFRSFSSAKGKTGQVQEIPVKILYK